MNVGTYCRHHVITIAPSADLAEAAACMRMSHVGLLVVVNPGERRPLGVLTDRDIVVEVVAADLPPRLITVRDAMTPNPVVARESELLSVVCERMRSMGVRRVPVVDDVGNLIGIVASDDVLDVSAAMLFNLSSAAHKEQSRERSQRV
ncbi:MAG: CBS domain-containing protein [Steroidobacteraceae bacterium]